MNIIAEAAVAGARHAVAQARRVEQRKGTVTAVSSTGGGVHGTATVQVGSYPTAVEVDNLADATVGDQVIVEFPSRGVAYITAFV